MKALHCGCGPNIIPGFINTDKTIWKEYENQLKPFITKVDVEKKFPYNDNTFEYIYSEHMIEHLSYEGAKNYISECYRCLKPGGIVRTAWPNVEFLIELYQNPQKYQDFIYNHCKLFHKELLDEFEKVENIPISLIINDKYHLWEHKVMYDIPCLKLLFKKSGFTNIKSVNYCESEHEILKNIEHSSRFGLEFYILETAIIECQKPI